MDKKFIIGIAVATLIVLVGGIFLVSKTSKPPVPEDQIVSNNGLHWHPKLSIYLEGVKQDIPANIGIVGSVHQEIHTHEEDAKNGVVHMEMQGIVSKDETRLGNFFKVWNRPFNASSILDKTLEPNKTITLLVNGTENTEFENYMMKDGDVLEIRYE